MYTNDPKEIIHNRLVLCEGPDDAQFIRALSTHYNLPAMNVFVTSDISTSPGDSGFKPTLEALRGLKGFDILQDIVIMKDCDDDPIEAFNFVTRQITNVDAPTPPDPPHTYPVPKTAHLKEAGIPSITVLMVPWHDRPGAFESPSDNGG